MNVVEMNEGLTTWQGERFLGLVDDQLQGNIYLILSIQKL